MKNLSLIVFLFVTSFLAYCSTPYVSPWLSHILSIAKRDQAVTVQQDTLDQYVMANTLVREQIAYLLYRVPSAVRVRIAVIQLPTFSITHSVAPYGAENGNTVYNLPISEWDDYLADLIAGHCVHRNETDTKSSAAMLRARELGVTDYITCPVLNSKNDLLGAVIVNWDAAHPIDASKYDSIKTEIKKTANVLGRNRLGG